MNKENSKPVFNCIPLVLTPEIHNAVMNFQPKYSGASNVVDYLKYLAWQDEQDGLQRTYLIMDTETNELAAFFSLKAGTAVMGISENDYSPTGHKLIPGIEISHLAVNKIYLENHPGVKNVGIYTFITYIMPKVIEAANIVGAKFAFIYALPDDELKERYETVYKFKRLPEEIESVLNRTTKPDYDASCTFMYIDLNDYQHSVQ